MSDYKNKDIVQEVFSRPNKDDDNISAIFSNIVYPSQVPLEKGGKGPSASNEIPVATDTGSSDNILSQPVKGTEHEIAAKKAIKHKELIQQIGTVVGAGLVLMVLVFFVGSHLGQHGNDSTKTMPQQQYVNRGEIVNPPAIQPLASIQPESVSKNISNSIAALDWQNVIDWNLLLDEISRTIPRKIQLSVIESGDSSEMFLEGRASSTDVVYYFVDALSANRQIKSAELTKNGIEKRNSEDLLAFSIICSLVSKTEKPGSLDGDHSNSGLDKNSLFSPKEAEELFDGIQQVSEDAGCTVNSLLVSPKNVVFKNENTNSRITKNHAVLRLRGGYQDISKTVEKLQNHSRGVWIDAMSIRLSNGIGGLECGMGISVYVVEDSGGKN